MVDRGVDHAGLVSEIAVGAEGLVTFEVVAHVDSSLVVREAGQAFFAHKAVVLRAVPQFDTCHVSDELLSLIVTEKLPVQSLSFESI